MRFLFRQRASSELRIHYQIDDQKRVQEYEETGEIGQYAFGAELWSALDMSMRFLGDAHQSRRGSQDENTDAEISVYGHVPLANWQSNAGIKEAHESKEELKIEQQHGGHSNPAMKGIHIRNWLLPQIVRIENSFQSYDEENEHHRVHNDVGRFRNVLPFMAKYSVDQYGFSIKKN